jgi:hypothetical protein
MPIGANYLLIVSMDVDPAKEDLFNEVYDTEHVPYLLKVPGVLSVTRTTVAPLKLLLGGETKTVEADGQPKHAAIYEIDSPDVLVSAEWADACEKGRWADEVRPFTSNRSHVLRKVTAS